MAPFRPGGLSTTVTPTAPRTPPTQLDQRNQATLRYLRSRLRERPHQNPRTPERTVCGNDHVFADARPPHAPGSVMFASAAAGKVVVNGVRARVGARFGSPVELAVFVHSSSDPNCDDRRSRTRAQISGGHRPFPRAGVPLGLSAPAHTLQEEPHPLDARALGDRNRVKVH